MSEKKAEVPEDRCGFELRPEDIGADLDRTTWDEGIHAVSCWRSVWQSHKGTGRCIWHADVDEKSIDELLVKRADGRERLDGAILRGIDADDQLSFSECVFIGAIFDSVNFPNADFTNTDLWGASFPDADLRFAEFTDADLRFAEFPNTNIQHATFSDAFLWGVEFLDADLRLTTFSNAKLRMAKFTDSNLRVAEFTDADLRQSNFSDANAFAASFQHANLQDAVFTRTECRKATFTSALLYETVFSDTRINSKTTFFDPETTFYNSITSRPGCVYEENPFMTDQLPEDIHTADPQPEDVHTADLLPKDVPPLEAARWVYRRLETLHEDNALSEAAREFHISKEEAERALYWEQGKYRRWGVKTLMWYLTRHGESVQRVLTWWGGVILTAGLLFSIDGGVTDSDGTPYAITSPDELATIAGWQDILMNIYFSVTTFSTIMDGGLAPAGNGTRAVVAVESITGALLVALLIFVLGRRVAR